MRRVNHTYRVGIRIRGKAIKNVKVEAVNNKRALQKAMMQVGFEEEVVGIQVLAINKNTNKPGATMVSTERRWHQ